MKRTLLKAVLACCLISSVGLVSAQTAQEQRVRGTVASIAADSITVRTASGQDVRVALTPNFGVWVFSPIKLTDVPPNAFVAITSAPTPEGKQRAQGIVIFPESMRGLNEGVRGWDLTPNSRMTNATVGRITAAAGGSELMIRIGNNETQTMQLTDRTQVASFVDGDRSSVTAGARVVVFAVRDSGGSLSAGQIGVGKDAYVPPV